MEKVIDASSPTEKTIPSDGCQEKSVSAASPTGKVIVPHSPTEKVIASDSPTGKVIASDSPTEKIVGDVSPTGKTIDVLAVTEKIVGDAAPTEKTVECDGCEEKVVAPTDSTEKDISYGGGAPPSPPVISNVHANSIARRGVRLDWDTDEPATCQVKMGTDDTEIGWTTYSKHGHLVMTDRDYLVTGLDPVTQYYFRVYSMDAEEAEAESDMYTFTTAGPGIEGVPPQVHQPEE